MVKTVKDHIGEYVSKGIYPFHMPGHKRSPAFSPWAAGFLGRDLTEIPGMDNLYGATGILGDFQARIARIYGADEAAFLVNGATGGILAAVMAACADGDCLIAARNSHRSVYGAMTASGARPCYVYPEMTKEGLAGQVSPDEVRRALEENPGCRAVLVTSPTYEGVVSDIAGIAQAARERGAMLIVDEAHGAHFPFHKAFPESALRLGADVAVVSFHKALPCPSQCAALLWNEGEREGDTRLIRQYLALTQTSSPSYAFMAITDEALTGLWENEEYFDNYVRLLTEARKRLAGMESLSLFERNGADIGKIVILTNGYMTGAELEKELFAAGIQIEMSGQGHALAMTSAADTPEGFGRLVDALLDIDKRREAGAPRRAGEVAPPPPLPRTALKYTPRQALRMKTERVSLSAGYGRASAEFIMPYPPGVPILAPGEVIDPAALGGYLDGYGEISVICD